MKKILLLLILFVAVYFRFVGINWDQNQHLHPDERFLTMVAQKIQWPTNINEYFDTNNSPLNPHNQGFKFFVYGTFPLFFVKLIADIFKLNDYNNITLIGRAISTIVDLLTVFVVYLITRRLIINSKLSINHYAPYLAAFFYAIMTLPIQLSHFFAVDTFLTFFLTLSFLIINYLPIRQAGQLSIITIIFLGITFGLAIASKITALLFLPVIGLSFIYGFKKQSNFINIFIEGLIFLLVTVIVIRVAQPYLFTNGLNLNPKIIDNWQQLKSFENPNVNFPPSIQWIKTQPILFPLQNMFFWGLGIPLSLIGAFSLIYSFSKIKNYWTLGLLIAWIIGLFLYQGSQFVKAMRYFLPLYPFLAIIAGISISHLINYLKKFSPNWIIGVFTYSSIGLLLIWPLAFTNIYRQPNSRVTASIWIYDNIPPNSIITSEHWDDGLPLNLPDFSNNYKFQQLPLYDPDSPQKWQKINQILEKTDYLILTSNRLYGSLTTVPDRYPETNIYYQKLFNGELEFEQVAEFTSRPTLSLPIPAICLKLPWIWYGKIADDRACQGSGIQFVDDYADETWTVYDHPKVIIFKKKYL